MGTWNMTQGVRCCQLSGALVAELARTQKAAKHSYLLDAEVLSRLLHLPCDQYQVLTL